MTLEAAITELEAWLDYAIQGREDDRTIEAADILIRHARATLGFSSGRGVGEHAVSGSGLHEGLNPSTAPTGEGGH